MIRESAPIKSPKILRKSFKDWLKGTVTAFDDGRTPTDGLRASGNVILDQDGTIRPRPSLIRYGTQPPGTILGEIFEFVRAESNVNVNYMMALVNVAGTTKIYYCKDGGNWTVANGKTYDNSARGHFVQVDNKVLVMNGIDYLSYLDIPTLAVTPFTALATPSAPTLTTNTGLTGTTLTYYYKITANSTVGETAASTALAVQVSTDRDIWVPTTQNLLISWSAVPGATSYNVYLGSTSGSETLLSAGINGLSFKDDGTLAPDVSRVAPVADTTSGPIATRGSVINGQVFLYGNPSEPRTIYYGGTLVGHQLDFSPFGEGGTLEIGRGTKEIPVKVMPFRDGRGNPQITVLCQGTNGSGKRYLLTPDSITLGETVINFFAVTEDNGQDGTDSPDGVLLYNDSLWYPSRDGFKTTGTKPQLQNLLSTDTVSETIIEDVGTLNNMNMDKCVGLAKQGRLYWAVPNGSTENNEIWVLDLIRGGAWMKPWNISASWMMLYNSNDGNSHHIVLSNNVIYELTHAQATNDDGTTFNTNATSGLIKFSEDGLEWAKVIDVTFMLLRPQGTINFLITGKTEDSTQLATLGSDSYVATSSVAGWGEAGWGGSPDAQPPQIPQIFGWSNFEVVPVSFADQQRPVVIEIDEELEWLTWAFNTNTPGTDFQLGDVIIRYVEIGVKDLT